MLGRSGSLLLFAIGVLGAVFLYTSYQPTSPDLPRKDIVSGVPVYEPGGNSCGIAGGALTPKERLECEKESELYRLQFSDLVQQTRAANAAEAQAQLSYEVAWMVLVGTVGAFLTLIAVIAAAIFARDAAKAAEESLSHATKTSEDELRPWLQLEIEPGLFRLTKEHAFAQYTLTLTNVGRLPARGVFTDSRIFNSGSETSEIKRYFNTRLKPGREGARTILPQGALRLERVARRGRAEIDETETDGQICVHPILAIQAIYVWGNGGRGQTCQSYEILRHGEGLRPIPVDPKGGAPRKFAVNHTMLDTVV